MCELVAQDVRVMREGHCVLDRVGFELKPKEILAVIGPNGAGKTSLMEAILGLVPLAGGQIQFDGCDLSTLDQRTKVLAFMPDDAEPPAEVRVDRLVKQALREAPVGRSRAEELVQKLDLTPLMGAHATSLSRGEKRRVRLFEALSAGRPVALLDEPLATLDPHQLLDISHLLRSYAEAGASLLLSVHQLAHAEKVASRFLFLNAGRVVAQGTAKELRARIGKPAASLDEVFLCYLKEARVARS